ncbi:hypothetical protein [Leekyejoonella antrihumi]|uniref:Uncharacterized protein n=1 Tax=Leekyejoonella antrihumi TaxID=1660198 RepID=A0A563DSP1_9MICO|nr:hypothetical protein [Leekyejoonella antrihumi]TWP32714.1 hypothetical protein FGL98_23480 [Leekyejoonella antrihumi]
MGTVLAGFRDEDEGLSGEVVAPGVVGAVLPGAVGLCAVVWWAVAVGRIELGVAEALVDMVLDVTDALDDVLVDVPPVLHPARTITVPAAVTVTLRRFTSMSTSSLAQQRLLTTAFHVQYVRIVARSLRIGSPEFAGLQPWGDES